MSEHKPLTKEDVWNNHIPFYDGSLHLFRVRSAVMWLMEDIEAHFKNEWHTKYIHSRIKFAFSPSFTDDDEEAGE